MPVVSAVHGLTFRQDYFKDSAAWAALVALLHDTFGIDVSIQDRFGGPDPTSMPFAHFDENGTCVANFSAFSMPMMIDGRLVRRLVSSPVRFGLSGGAGDSSAI